MRWTTPIPISLITSIPFNTACSAAIFLGNGRVATNSRTTHWAAEIRGDLYETIRDKEYRLPWEWKATILMTAEEVWKKEPQRKVVERLHIGTTALNNTEIARRGK
jgi:hypothetical protein